MSQSPSEQPQDASQSAYRQQIARLDRLVEDGESWSGNERNCAFLNLGPDARGSVRFASAASVLGLNVSDDARAHALVDWDQDGDLDIWTTNRTAPRLRFMRNEGRTAHRFLAVRLVGKTCNRDAIGSVVKIRQQSMNQDRETVRTVYAGSGFLAQSSKWIHFGLGTGDRIEAIDVSWPDGRSQSYSGLKPNRRYVLTQDESAVREMPIRNLPEPRPIPLVLPESTEEAAILLSSRVPLPPLPYKSFDGKPQRLEPYRERPVLLNFWASWCAPCLTEMNDMTSQRQRFEDAGVDVLSLSLDGFLSQRTQEQATTLEDAQRAITKLHFPFPVAVAIPETVRRLEFVDGLLFGRRTKLTLPTSFLISADGHLAAVYRGLVTIDRVVRDAKTLSLSDAELLSVAMPFPGVWFDGRRRFAPLSIVADLIDHRANLDAYSYVRNHAADLSTQNGFAEVVGSLGTRLASQNKMTAAIEMYQHALLADPNNIPVLNNLAWHLATHSDGTIRQPREAIRYAKRAASLTQFRSVPILDTLATAYLAANDLAQAGETLDRAIDLARATGNSDETDRLVKKRQSKVEQQAIKD